MNKRVKDMPFYDPNINYSTTKETLAVELGL
jgi:hypothetical protein